MSLELAPDRRTRAISHLKTFYLEQFDEDLSDFRADQLLDFTLEVIGPQIYNQAVQDARGYMQLKLDDLDGDVHVPDAG